MLITYLTHSKWFEPRSISSSYCVVVRVRVVLKRTVVSGNWRFDNLSGSHLRTQLNSICRTFAQVFETSVTDNSSFQNYPHLDDHTVTQYEIFDTSLMVVGVSLLNEISLYICSLFESQKQKMSSITFFFTQLVYLFLLLQDNLFYFSIKIVTEATAAFVPIAVLCIWR